MVPGEAMGEYEGTAGLVSIDREGEQRKIVTTVRVMAPGPQKVLSAKFYPETGAVKRIRIRKPDGNHLGSAEFRKDGRVEWLQRYKSNEKSTRWKFDREGNIVDEYSVGHSWD